MPKILKAPIWPRRLIIAIRRGSADPTTEGSPQDCGRSSPGAKKNWTAAEPPMLDAPRTPFVSRPLASQASNTELSSLLSAIEPAPAAVLADEESTILAPWSVLAQPVGLELCLNLSNCTNSLSKSICAATVIATALDSLPAFYAFVRFLFLQPVRFVCV
jgi:hypothetical protein